MRGGGKKACGLVRWDQTFHRSIVGAVTCVEELLRPGGVELSVTGSNTALAGPGWRANSPDNRRELDGHSPTCRCGVSGIPIVATPCASTCLATHHESAVITHKGVSLGRELCVGPIPLLRAPGGPGSTVLMPSAGMRGAWNGTPHS